MPYIPIYFFLLDNHKAEKNPSPSSIHTNSSGGEAPSSLTSMTNSVKVVHMSVRKTQSDPPDQLPSSRPSSRSMLSSEPPRLLPRNPTTSVVVIEHTTKMAVNNNVGEENQNQLQDGKTSSSSEKQIQSHIFVWKRIIFKRFLDTYTYSVVFNLVSYPIYVMI